MAAWLMARKCHVKKSCLPITQDTSLLETSLSEAQYLINKEHVKYGIMRAYGVLSDQGDTATATPPQKKFHDIAKYISR